MIMIVVIYVGLVICYARSIGLQVEGTYDKQLADTNQSYQKIISKKQNLYQAKMKLEEESLRIFTLYEITKEITKSLSEEEAFEFFKDKLREHVAFKECFFLEPLSNEENAFRKLEDYFVFTLQGKSEKIGYLIVQGVLEEDQEKVMILGHQFALALRRVQLYEQIEKIAITDSLTEVYTRRYIMDRFQEEIKRSMHRKIKMSFLMVDVDFFKAFNDKYGHLSGDQILKEIAGIIKENIREIDIAGRYGGEEFCIILPDTDGEGAQFVAERIRQAAEKKEIKAYDTTVKATLSIGATTFPEDGKDAPELIDKADWALYRAKKLGRNRVCSFGVYKDS